MKIRLKYYCQEMLLAFKTAAAPTYLLRARQAHRAHQKRLARGFPYSIAEAITYRNCSLWNESIRDNVSVEANSAWLDDPSLVKPISAVLSLRKQGFGCGFNSAGKLSIRGSAVLEVDFGKKAPRPNFAAWAEENNLKAMFRVKVKDLDEYEVLKEVAQVGIRPPARGPTHAPAKATPQNLPIPGGATPAAGRDDRRVTIRFVMSRGSTIFPDYASWPEEKRNLDFLDSCMTFFGSFSFIEDKIVSWRLLDPGFDQFIFKADRLAGCPFPVVEFLLRDSVRRLNKAEFLAYACDASYRLEIPGVNGHDPYYFEDQNGYSGFIRNRIQASPPWQGGNAEANVEKCIATIQRVLTDTIRKNRSSLRAGGDGKVRSEYTGEPFDLDERKDWRRRGLREFIHWIMYFEEMYQLFLTEPQYAECVGVAVYTGQIPYRPDGQAAADRTTRARLREIYRRCTQHVNVEFKALLGRKRWG